MMTIPYFTLLSVGKDQAKGGVESLIFFVDFHTFH